MMSHVAVSAVGQKDSSASSSTSIALAMLPALGSQGCVTDLQRNIGGCSPSVVYDFPVDVMLHEM